MFKHIKASFIEQRRATGERVRLVCRETGDIYTIAPAPLGGLEIRCNGNKLGERSNMCWALDFLQRDAELAVRELGKPEYREMVVAPRGQRLMVQP